MVGEVGLDPRDLITTVFGAPPCKKVSHRDALRGLALGSRACRPQPFVQHGRVVVTRIFGTVINSLRNRPVEEFLTEGVQRGLRGFEHPGMPTVDRAHVGGYHRCARR